MWVYLRVWPQPITTAWIYHNSDLWLISLSSDWINWITIADKNLWATQVRNDGDTLSEANCGKFYQWGNNYGFPFTWSVTTSSTQVNAQNYWPWNYYSSSTFIIRNSSPYDWSSVKNDNLWGWTTWTNEAMQWPSLSGFHVPTKDEWVGLYGMLINTFSMADNATTMGTYLKMPMAGRRLYSDASVIRVGSEGSYWSSTSYYDDAYYLSFTSSNIYSQSSTSRVLGFSVRSFKNDAVQPDVTRTVLYQ